MNDKLIVALDVPTVKQAKKIISQLDGIVSIFKIGMWLFFANGSENLINGLVMSDKQVFLDAKMYDIGKTVEEGVKHAVDRGVSIVTVHGDYDIMASAVKGKGFSDLKVFGISVLTSMNDESLKDMGYALSTEELIHKRVKMAAEIGCDGMIASASDNPDLLRTISGNEEFLIGTPGIRGSDDPINDHARSATPIDAVKNGSDYLIVGRPIISYADPATRAMKILADMEEGQRLRNAI